MKKRAGIKGWVEAERPREKLLDKGRQNLTDAELIAILIGSGSFNESAVALAKRILAGASNNLHDLSRFSVADFTTYRGIGKAKAITIIAALELGRRRKEAHAPQKNKITSSKDVYEFIQPVMLDLPYEEFWLILLNRANAVIRKEMISRGGVAGTVVDIRVIFKAAVTWYASSIIICHNHPSGNLNPSEADIRITKTIKEAGRIMEITLFDHLIVTDDGYYSFADEGQL